MKASTWFMALCLISVCLTNCSLEKPWESLSEGSTSDLNSHYQTPVGGNFKALTINNKISSLNIDTSSKDDVVLVMYSNNSKLNRVAFELDDTAKSSSLIKTNKLEVISKAGSFDQWLRDREASLTPEDIVADSSQNHFLTKTTQRTFKVINSFSNNTFSTVTAELAYENDYYEIYIDERNLDQFTDDDIVTIGDQFEETMLKEQHVFGEESDVNGDGKFAILLTQAVNELGASAGSMITGFFYALDLFDDNKYPFSNEMEILYSCVPDPKGDNGIAISKSFALKSILPSVIPHEYQHMINFNQHHFIENSVVEKGWLNEALSHLAEDFMEMDEEGVISSYAAENPSRVFNFLSEPHNTCFTCGTSLQQRGGSYLFIKYLYEQAELGLLPGSANGIEFLRSLVQTDKQGVYNVVYAAYGEDDKNLFLDLLADFSLAVYLSDTDFAADETQEFFGMKLRGAQNDYRGTYLQGPSMIEVDALPFNFTMPGVGVAYLQIPKELLTKTKSYTLKHLTTVESVGGFLVWGD
ncbi:hypothetical protein KJ708_03830 [bacterium]|nr:hypothetical protein [bacterium]